MIVGFPQIPREFYRDYFKALVLLALVPLFPEYLSFFLIVGALVFAIKDIKTSGANIKIGTLGWMITAYCLYLSVTCIYSTHPLQSVLATVLWWFMLLAYLMIVNLITDKHRLDSFLFCVSTVAGLVGFIAFVQNRLNVYFGVPICSLWDWLDRVVFAVVPFDLTLVSFPTRSYSTFPNPNMLAQYLIMAAPAVIAYNFIENRIGMRLYNRSCLVMTAVGVMVSFSRGGYLALISLALVLIIINIRKRFATVLLYLSTSLLFIPKTVYSRLTTLNASGRLHIWAEAVRKIAQRPLFGYGAGTEPSAVIFDRVGLDAPHAHNMMLQVLMEGGCVALIILAAIALVLFKNGLSLLRSKNTSSFWAGFAMCGFVCATFLHGMVDYPLTTPKLICCFLSLLALAERFFVLYADKQNRKKTPRGFPRGENCYSASMPSYHRNTLKIRFAAACKWPMWMPPVRGPSPR